MASSTIELPILTKNLEYAISQRQIVLTKGILDEQYFWVFSKAIVETYRYGLCLLLGQTSLSGFDKQMINSAALKKKLHEQARPFSEFHRYALGSQYLPALGTWISGDLTLAKSLAQESNYSFNEDYEYEEDYVIGQFFYQALLSDFKIGGFIDSILEKLEELEEGESARFALISALKDKEQTDFNGAILALIEEHQAFYDKIEGTMSVDKEKFTTEKAIHLEGLAWLKLAKTIGLNIETEYAYIPRLLTARL